MSRPIAPLGNRLGRAPQVSKELKKSCLLERRAGRRRHNACGSGNPSPQLYSARAPIHPKRPYGLTRPVVPPDGSLIYSKPLFLLDAAASCVRSVRSEGDIDGARGHGRGRRSGRHRHRAELGAARRQRHWGSRVRCANRKTSTTRLPRSSRRSRTVFSSSPTGIPA